MIDGAPHVDVVLHPDSTTPPLNRVGGGERASTQDAHWVLELPHPLVQAFAAIVPRRRVKHKTASMQNPAANPVHDLRCIGHGQHVSTSP